MKRVYSVATAVMLMALPTARAVVVSSGEITGGTSYTFKTTVQGTSLLTQTESSSNVFRVTSSNEDWINITKLATTGQIVLKFDFSGTDFHPDSFKFETAVGFATGSSATTATTSDFYSLDGVNWTAISGSGVTISAFSNPPKLDTGTVTFSDPSSISSVYFKAVLTHDVASNSTSGAGIRWGWEGNTGLGSTLKQITAATLIDPANGFAIQFTGASIPEPSSSVLLSGLGALIVTGFATRRRGR